jgi:hypothetical protein
MTGKFFMLTGAVFASVNIDGNLLVVSVTISYA